MHVLMLLFLREMFQLPFLLSLASLCHNGQRANEDSSLGSWFLVHKFFELNGSSCHSLHQACQLVIHVSLRRFKIQIVNVLAKRALDYLCDGPKGPHNEDR